jgi:hypothetical protein
MSEKKSELRRRRLVTATRTAARHSHDDADEKPGMRKTDTIDVIPVVSSQVYTITNMRPGWAVVGHG